MSSVSQGMMATFILCFFANVLCFLDRVNISIAAPFIMAAYGWNESQMGLVFSAFFAGYVLFMIPGGVIADRFGARRVLPMGVGFFSLFTLLTPYFSGLWTMVGCRYLVGTGQGVNFPCVSNLIVRRAPLHHRAKIQAFTLSGLTLGTVLGFPIGSWIISVWGWEAIFLVFALFGFVWIGFWVWKGPREAIANLDSPDEPREPIPWRLLLLHPSSLGLTLSYFCHNYAGYLFLVWLPVYLIQVHGFSITGTGISAALPAVASGICMNLSGWISDALVRRGVSRGFSRTVLLYLGMGLSGVTLLGLIWINNPYLAVGCVTCSSAFKALATPAYWTLTLDMAPKQAGILSSIMNTSGNIAGVVASMLTGWMLSEFGGWNPVLLVASGITLAGVAIAVPTVRSQELSEADSEARS